MTGSMDKAHDAPRCAARSKRSGLPCRAPAVRGWTVCRMHGAGGGAPSGEANPNWKHGGRSQELEAIRRLSEALRGQSLAINSDLLKNT